MTRFVMTFLICLPLKFLVVTSPYGFRPHPITRVYAFHNGVDLRASYDTVYSVASGKVDLVANDAISGNYIVINHGNWQSYYCHISGVFCMEGDSVSAGSPIAISGASGRVTAPHLHFAIRVENHFVNPLQFIYQLLIHQEHE